MPFIKVVKNKAYFKRFQVKYRRRREGKTDYQARRALIIQDKNKYNAPKYRFVVRFTNTDVICQIIYAKITGDVVMSAAYSHELKRYGLPVGHTNYASSYATGLLLARRHLDTLGLAEKYTGKTEIDGEDFLVEPLSDGPRPFLALLDVGLARTTTGARVFGALKGALDGGLNIPHSEKRFYGYDSENKKLDAALLRKVIFGGHVSDYMKKLADDDPKKYSRQFARYIKAGISPDKLESTLKEVHASIRKSPKVVHTTKKKPEKPKRWGRRKLTLPERKNRIKNKTTAHRKKLAAAAAKAEQ
jgi:large subunit ribosomal protein L5e